MTEHPGARPLYCMVHGIEHRADWPWEGSECFSERDLAIEAAAPDPADAPLPPLGWRERFPALIRCWIRGWHSWRDDGPTLGGIWLRCRDCRTGEEYLPGLHEPKGGEVCWLARLRRAGVA